MTPTKKRDLPTLPLTLSIVDGQMTTGHPVEDERIAGTIVEAQRLAKMVDRMLWVYECPKHGPTISDTLPDRFETSFITIYPGGRQVFMPLRTRR